MADCVIGACASPGVHLFLTHAAGDGTTGVAIKTRFKSISEATPVAQKLPAKDNRSSTRHDRMVGSTLSLVLFLI